MIKTKLAATVTAVAMAAGMGIIGMAAAPTASAQEELPTYRCEVVDLQDLPRATGYDCQAVGAPEQGPIFGEFRIQGWFGETVTCEVIRPFSGIAELPDQVTGFNCHVEEGGI
ncbi:hypothetical protein SRB5_03000 [Streptomyces sp. RB5]|uniref:Uncharacterized protein n=1 Tax=Streptomyces smaragdinus TaxID=2585196 RepID=A0A7K0C9Y0_9ACTN|nr:hypothetical protein [Streptomyces smaragdinus]MQY10193.1 hypothetical protein [Streptomyces smaragdinus]